MNQDLKAKNDAKITLLLTMMVLIKKIWVKTEFFRISTSVYRIVLGFYIFGCFGTTLLLNIGGKLSFRLNGVEINVISRFQEEMLLFMNSCLAILKNEFITNKKLNQVTKKKKYVSRFLNISKIIIMLIILLIVRYSAKLNEQKQHISYRCIFTMFMNYSTKSQIIPLLGLNKNDIIWSLGFWCENQSIDQERSYFNDNINIVDCFFSRSSLYSGDGGVIYVNGGSFSMNVNYSMFYNCVCSNQGGAIFFYSSYSYLRMICAHRCSASDYHFAHLRASQVNEGEYLSVSYCSHIISGSYSVYLRTGNQRVDNTNSSMNNANKESCIYIYLPSLFKSIFCTFSNNNVGSWTCISFYSTTGITVTMSFSNIVHNNSPSYGVVTVSGIGSRKMMYCVYKNNQGYLFYVLSRSLEVSHSFIDHSESSLSTSSAVTIANNNSFTSEITYQIQLFQSYYCNADIPLIDTSPNQTFQETAQRSPEETIRRTKEATLRFTYVRTIDCTIEKSSKETIPRTFSDILCSHQMVNKREIKIIFSFSFFYFLNF